MKTIPQRELRNASGKILREAEAGEQFVVTVDGRPVATLGPYRKRTWVSKSKVLEVLQTPTDETLLNDLKAFDAGDQLMDPWEQR